MLKLKVIGVSKNNKFVICGSDIFKMVDTYGFPLDFVIEEIQQRNYLIDWYGFIKSMSWKPKTLISRLKDTSLNDADIVAAKITWILQREEYLK